MINQQVNFYASMPKLGPVKLPLSLMLKIWVALILLAACLYGFESWVVGKQQTQLSYQQKQQKLVTQQMASLSGQLPGDSKLPALLQVKANLQTAVDTKTQLLKLLADNKLNTAGFAQYFVAVAYAMPSMVWLQSIEIGEGGKAMRLTGKSYDADAITELSHNLQSSAVFKGWHFQLEQVETDPTSKGSTNTLNFVLEAQYGNT